MFKFKAKPERLCGFVHRRNEGGISGWATDVEQVFFRNKVFIKIFCKSTAFSQILAEISKFFFKTGCFPKIWKKARVVPVFKSGEIHNIDNYRPLSMLCCLSKIIESVTFNHIYSFLMKERLLHKLQSGSRHLHSTIIALLHLINTVAAQENEQDPLFEQL